MAVPESTRSGLRWRKDVVEHKYYAENVGFMLGVVVKGGHERTELVSIITGGPGD